ncbi:zinc-binding alcohol dehydrogenase family protein [Mucilaginibacter glaciei]|uniref:Zinc-binding dehydrogenase n=1 Tax=Mucilaginibacter glaciei TaxID=2772109 RepID=A0A926NVK2_9SPHI|nr:zinc-binding alcohol dehydrogenase family protein [Mucilaginibacter glaciei]MBD1392524.1 zinc-binding dehydrogenase [Mucilaginibacter glaciei]
MKAAVISNPGGPENLVIEERALPVIKDGWVLVKVMAFGLNRSELMTRKGYSPNVKFPRVLGIECVGVVDNDPSGQYQPGQKVAACMGGMGRDFDGSYAEYTLLPKELLYPFKSHLAWDQLGALPEMFETVYGSLHLALKIKSGDILLIRGGTSSIGLLAAQMAKQSGVKVVATTRDDGRKAMLTDNGAQNVIIDSGEIASKVREVYPTGVDKVLELIGTVTLKDSLASAAPGGSVCMTGMLAEKWSVADFAPMEFIPATVSLTVYDSGQVKAGKEHFQSFINDVESGAIKLSLGKVFNLADIQAAHQLMDSNRAGGKIVVTTNS